MAGRLCLLWYYQCFPRDLILVRDEEGEGTAVKIPHLPQSRGVHKSQDPVYDVVRWLHSCVLHFGLSRESLILSVWPISGAV
jgi:hypothetical protein